MASPSQSSPAAIEAGAATIGAVADLVRRDHVSIEFRPLPPAALGRGVLTTTPHVAIIREGDKVSIQSLKSHIEEARGKPFHRSGTALVETLESFIDLVNRHKVRDESVIFAATNWRAPALTAVIDYHTQPASEAWPGIDGAFEDPCARRGRHRVHYDYPLSDAWKEWVKGNREPMDQADFAAFLEDHITDLASPTETESGQWENDFKAKFATPAELIDLSRGLEVMVGARVKNKTRLQSGETQMVFEVDHQTRDADGNALTVPGLFLLSVPPFHRGDAIRIPCRLRYRASGGALVWFYEMIQPDRFIDEHLRADADAVRSATGLPYFAGRAEMSA